MKIMYVGLMAGQAGLLTEMCQNLSGGVMKGLVMGVSGHQPGMILGIQEHLIVRVRAPSPSQGQTNCLKLDITHRNGIKDPAPGDVYLSLWDQPRMAWWDQKDVGNHDPDPRRKRKVGR